MGSRFGRGVYAGSIRFHDGRFWVHFTTLDEGIFVVTAEHPARGTVATVVASRYRGWLVVEQDRSPTPGEDRAAVAAEQCANRDWLVATLADLG